MEHDSNYIKDVENYFLSLAGEGIMLSSVDYNLIMEWRNKEIPKEVVFKGINKAFQDFKSKEGQGQKSARNLKRCATYIQESIEEYSPIIGRTYGELESLEANENLEALLGRLSTLLKSAKDDTSGRYYDNLKDKISSLIKTAGEDTIAYIPGIEEQCLNDLFSSLSDSERESISIEAKAMLGNRVKHMTNEALEESITSFRNELLTTKYKLKSLISNEVTDG